MAKRGINKAVILGNLGGDPEQRFMPNGNAVTNITVATSGSWKDQQGQEQSRTEWHRIIFFNKLAEIAGEYLRKGSKVYVEGSLRTRKWQGQDGQDRYTTEIVASELQMLDSRSDDHHGNGAQSQNHAPQQRQKSAQAPQQQQGGYVQPPPYQPQGGMDDFSDDLPF